MMMFACAPVSDGLFVSVAVRVCRPDVPKVEPEKECVPASATVNLYGAGRLARGSVLVSDTVPPGISFKLPKLVVPAVTPVMEAVPRLVIVLEASGVPATGRTWTFCHV